MALHKLDCPYCDVILEVATKHAGQSRECSGCSKDVEIPKLGQLKLLPTVESDASVRRSANPSQLRGWLFSGGLLLASIFGIAGYALHNYAQSLYNDVDGFSAQVAEVSEESIRNMPDSEFLDWWMMSSDSQLGEWKEHPGVGYNVQSKILSNIALGMYGLAGLGVLSMISSFLVTRNK